MAAKKASSATPKKTGTKKRTAAPAARKKAQPRGRSTSQKGNQMTAEAIRQRNQIRAVVLFACAILLACLVLIQGDNLWSWAHGAILGIFGSWALLWPVLMIYVAVVTALDKPRGSIGGKVWLTVLVIVLFCTTGFIFSAKPVPEGLNFGQYISYLYLQNPGTSGGVVGGLLGYLCFLWR